MKTYPIRTYYLLTATYRHSPYDNVVVLQTGKKYELEVEKQCYAKISADGKLTLCPAKKKRKLTEKEQESRREIIRQFCYISKEQAASLIPGEETKEKHPVRKDHLTKILTTDLAQWLTYRHGKALWQNRKDGVINIEWINYGQHPLEDSLPQEIQNDFHILWAMHYAAKFYPIDRKQISDYEDKVANELADLRDRKVITPKECKQLAIKYVDPNSGNKKQGENNVFEA